jgi:DNA-binding CsgD family transcriptional regulator
VQQLAAETIAAEPGPGLLTELSGAAGNPLFVTELIGALDQAGALHTTGGRAEITESAFPPTLRLTILHRLSFLPDSTLEVLRAASMLGSTFSLTDLAAVTDRPALDLSEALTPAIRARVVADDGVSLLFRHDLIREAIYEDLPAPVRRELHREFGQRLALSGAPALQVAEHFSRGSTTGDAETIGWLTRAAREVAAASPTVAADLLERAVRLTDPADPGRDRLLVEQASSLMWTGRVAAAEHECRALLDRAHDPDADGSARICLANSLLGAGRAREALRELQCAIQSARLTDAERAGARGWAGIAHLWLGDLDEAAAVARQAQSAAAACEDHLTTAIALAVLAEVSELHGQLDDALQVVDEAVRRADLSPDRQGHRYPLHAVRGSTLIELDRLAEAGSTVEVGRRISEELGIGWHLPSYQARRSAAYFLAGEWDDAIVEVEASTELAAETGLAFGLAFGHSVLSLISLHRNDLRLAKAALSKAMARQAEPGTHFRVQWVAWAQSMILEADSKTAEALATLGACWDWCNEHGHTREYRIFGPDMVRLAVAGAANGRAREAATAVAALAEQNPQVPSLAGAALRCRGLAEDDPDFLLAAVDAYRTDPRPLELAMACEDAGTALVRHGDADRARPLLEQAIRSYERLDAARDRARAEAVARAAGIRHGRRGPRGRPQTGWSSLTPTERTIAMLVAEGLSNPQIGDRLYISRRTVQAHLAHIFRKLDIASRAQLAAETSRRVNRDPAN